MPLRELAFIFSLIERATRKMGLGQAEEKRKMVINLRGYEDEYSLDGARGTAIDGRIAGRTNFLKEDRTRKRVFVQAPCEPAGPC